MPIHLSEVLGPGIPVHMLLRRRLAFALLALAACGVSPARITSQDQKGALGVGCATGNQCASGGCSADLAPGTCGVCLDVRPLGASCAGPMQTCRASAVCEQGTCRSHKQALGGTCRLGPKGGDHGDCDDELYCEAGTCLAAIPIGATCLATQSHCDRNGVCERGVCLPSWTAQLAETCDRRSCDRGLVCTDRTCRLGTLKPNQPCGIVDGAFINDDCSPGTVCGNLQFPNGGGGSGTPYSCVPLPEQGQPCVSYSCAPGLFCLDNNEAKPTCERPRSEGQPCGDFLCATGLDCLAGRCATACH